MGSENKMNTKQWDKDIEKSLKELRIADEEIKRHMYNLWSLSGGKIGKRPPEGEEGGISLFFLILF